MAMGRRFTCERCGFSIEAWDEGNPYYIDKRGKKRYAYHPDPERERCTGIESPHLCLTCGIEFPIDSNAPVNVCPKCQSAEIADTFDLESRVCPACETGTFKIDRDLFALS